jgi:hypothetical protein
VLGPIFLLLGFALFLADAASGALSKKSWAPRKRRFADARRPRGMASPPHLKRRDLGLQAEAGRELWANPGIGLTRPCRRA